jgi:hypothetical protein
MHGVMPQDTGTFNMSLNSLYCSFQHYVLWPLAVLLLLLLQFRKAFSEKVDHRCSFLPPKYVTGNVYR